MKHAIFAAVTLLALSSSAFAQLTLRVEHETVAQGTPTATIDVWVEEPVGQDFTVASFSVGLRLVPTASGVTVSSFGGPSARPLFTDNSTVFDFTGSQGTYNAQYDRFITDDTNSPFAPVENGVREGLFSITYNITPGTTGTFQLNIHTLVTEFSNAAGGAIAYTPVNGSITILPEPSMMGLALLGLPLLARRRR